MGQYYRAIVKKQNGRMTVYNRYVIIDGNREYTPAKLMEHSWWLNDFVNAVCLDVYESKEKRRIAWIGDYADDYLEWNEGKTFNGLNRRQIVRLFHQCRDCDGVAVKPTDFNLDGKFLVNHTKKEYVDCSKFFTNSVMHTKNGDWCIHPLPLLTCIGNGLGGGDYTDATDNSTEDYVGYWAWNEISIEDTAPADYAELCPIFKENGRENDE